MDAVPLVVLTGSLVGARVHGYLMRRQLAGGSGEISALQTEVKEKRRRVAALEEGAARGHVVH